MPLTPARAGLSHSAAKVSRAFDLGPQELLTSAGHLDLMLSPHRSDRGFLALVGIVPPSQKFHGDPTNATNGRSASIGPGVRHGRNMFTVHSATSAYWTRGAALTSGTQTCPMLRTPSMLSL